ncbi:MAG: hypothetical protein LJF04_17545 [Gemmatimonadetes bacterium]|nr:hypothetical protein [Gemmatimonadota bacterium]
MTAGRGDALLTLEPLIDAVREGAVSAAWALSGLQKTTSHEFEGNWAGDSTRSAYLFFHVPAGYEWASLDVYLDETSRGLAGNLALALDGRTLGEMGDVARTMEQLASIAAETLPQEFRTPVTLRVRLERPSAAPASAGTELRFKIRIPMETIARGGGAVSSMAAVAATALRRLLDQPRLQPFLAREADSNGGAGSDR